MKTIKRSIIYFSLSVLALLILTSGVKAQDAHNLLAKLDNIMFSPKDKQGKITIILISKTGKEKVREAEMFQKGRDKKLFRYTQPESQAGIATLSLPDGVMWLYMPAFGSPKKISLLAKSQAFTGTDFSYEDMATQPYAERFYPILVEIKEDAYVLELTPRTDKSSYSKVVVRQDKTNYFPIMMEYYDKGGRKFKEATYQYEKIGNYWNAKEVIMRDLKKEHTTKILLTDIIFDQGLTDEFFTKENLKQED